MVEIYPMSAGLRANVLLKHNIEALLRGRKIQQKDLAFYLMKHESWISHVLRSPSRGIPLRHLDRIADFFGVAVYQLFQPGISALAERRHGRERRSGKERRLGRHLP